MDPTRFNQLAETYMKEFHLSLCILDRQGNIVRGTPSCTHDSHSARGQEARRLAIEETLRWGEPYLHLCQCGCMLWAAPIMYNAELQGGILADGVSVDESTPRKWSATRIRQAAHRLLELAGEANLSNVALLKLHKMESEREARYAEAIHELKSRCYDSIRDIYLKEEPGLLAAVKRGDRRQGREVLNRVLVGIYFLGRDRPSLLKSLLLELVVMMSRSAVEAGAEPSELLGTNYSSLVELAGISDEADLSGWLVSMLERIMDSIKEQRAYPNTVLLGAALQFMEKHLENPISRDDAAAAASLSPSYFSRLMKEKLGRSFTDVLTQMRIDRSKELLRRTEKSIVAICLECGFSDQSYFTKVFQRFTGCTPRDYRLRIRTSFR